MALTLDEIKELVKKLKAVSVDAGPEVFIQLSDWSKSEEFCEFLLANKLVSKSHVLVGTDTILFRLGVNILITKVD